MARGGTSRAGSPARGAGFHAARAGTGAFALLALLLVAALAGCGRGGERAASNNAASQTGEAVPDRARSEALIQAGNDAYRDKNYELALKRYAAAAVADPRDPAAYFGMGMTFTRLKRDDEARAAYARAQQLSREDPAAPATP